MSMIVREPTRNELTRLDESGDVRGFVPILTPTGNPSSPEDKFNKKINEEQQKAMKVGLPFAEASVRADVKDIVDNFNKSWKRQGYVDTDYKFPKVDWAKYSDLKNFELLDEGSKLDDNLSKIHKIPVYIKFSKYKYKGFSNEYTVMEDPLLAAKRALKELESHRYENKKALEVLDKKETAKEKKERLAAEKAGKQ